mmetsp:Transcript_73455/g.204051  ORF Transcript_73455/g.204051 Transcript_73455/m.204051 type:complete len:200 (-) Transcript_73455:142-741(-)
MCKWVNFVGHPDLLVSHVAVYAGCPSEVTWHQDFQGPYSIVETLRDAHKHVHRQALQRHLYRAASAQPLLGAAEVSQLLRFSPQNLSTATLHSNLYALVELDAGATANALLLPPPQFCFCCFSSGKRIHPVIKRRSDALHRTPHNLDPHVTRQMVHPCNQEIGMVDVYSTLRQFIQSLHHLTGWWKERRNDPTTKAVSD